LSPFAVVVVSGGDPDEPEALFAELVAEKRLVIRLSARRICGARLPVPG
jgi:hypothetical protein